MIVIIKYILISYVLLCSSWFIFNIILFLLNKLKIMEKVTKLKVQIDTGNLPVSTFTLNTLPIIYIKHFYLINA